jgi:hypothetical protein
MATTALRIGQSLRGRLSRYTITKQLHETVWLARCVDDVISWTIIS